MKKLTIGLIITFIIPALIYANTCTWSNEECITSVHQHEEHWTLFTSCNDGSTFTYQESGQHTFPDYLCLE